MPPTKLLKQRDLEDILKRRQVIEGLKKEVKREEDELAKVEELAKYALANGTTVERGSLVAGIEEKEGPRRPPYKELYAQVAGPAAIEKAIAECVPTVVRKLVILRNGKAAA